MQDRAPMEGACEGVDPGSSVLPYSVFDHTALTWIHLQMNMVALAIR
jgi:hypothetical protein